MVIDDLNKILPLIIYVLLIVLIVVLISFFIKANKTLDKANEILDDADKKLHSFDGIFGIVTAIDSRISTSVGKLIGFFDSVVDKLFNKMKKKTIEDEELDELLKEEK